MTPTEKIANRFVALQQSAQSRLRLGYDMDSVRRQSVKLSNEIDGIIGDLIILIRQLPQPARDRFIDAIKTEKW